MGVTPDGWLDWAERLPDRSGHVNGGTSSVRGIFMHSAEGYAGTLLDPRSQWGYQGSHSWHLTNLFDGRVFQHHPFTDRCWHATAANQEYVGVENEGHKPNDPTLNQLQVNNAVRFIRDIADWKGWEPRRPANTADKAHTLWEHREVVRIGGDASSCPSGRIPWPAIMDRLNPPPLVYIPHDIEALGELLSAITQNQRVIWANKGERLVEVVDEFGQHMNPRHYFYV